MRVLLIFKDSVAVERMGIMQISASLKHHGHDVRLVVVGPTDAAEIPNVMREFKPEVLGYSAMTGEHVSLLEINRELKKEFDFLTVFGGPHATFCPDLIEEDGVDAICTGEGDLVFPEFCQRIENDEEYWKSPTFHVKYKGEIHRNPLANLTPDLSELPFPDRTILYDADPNMAKAGTKYFMAGRGCPYKCSYCFNVKYNESYDGKGKIVRTRTPQQIVEEIEWVRERYPLDHVSFLDDIFLLKPREWIDEFCEIYPERVGLPFSGTVRANALKDEVIEKLQKAGMAFVWMGVESGNEKVANTVLARGLSNEQVIAAARTLQKHNVGLITQNLIGLPVDDPLKVDLETLDLNIKIKPTFGWSSILYPYPGSPIETFARLSGHLKGEPVYMETNKRTSMLEFSSEKEKLKIINLHKLFGIVVTFPFLRPYVEFLSSLPLTRFYTMIYYAWYGFSYKIRLTGFKSTRKDLPYLISVFFRMVAKG
jgi:anaerobic magnesium-protoporphyrin IX monomethyl ester cyclase